MLATGALPAVASSAVGFKIGDLELANASSSSISNIRSMVESFGRMTGLKGAFRAALDFLRPLSWLGELAYVIEASNTGTI